MAILRIKRDAGWHDKLRAYKLFLDGAKVGLLKEGEQLTLRIPSGNYRIIAKIDWCSSPEVECDISENETIEFRCCSALRGFQLVFAPLFVLFFKNRYLKLDRTI